MEIFHFIVIGLFALLGTGVLNTASQTKFKDIGLLLGGLSYIGGAIAAYLLLSWYPLLVAFIVAWAARSLAGKNYL